MSEKNGHQENGRKPGGRGADAPLSPVAENKIVSMMLNPRRRWKLNSKAKQAAVNATLCNLANKDARVVNGAVANLIRMEGQNQAEFFKTLDKEVPDLLEIGTSKQQEARSAILSDAEYLAYREQKRLAPSHNGTNGHAKNGHNGNGHV